MKELIVADDKSDGLEIASIGNLYEGPWEKKYWSSSRGKDRHPYPVGYVASREYNGNTYKMAIFEGLKGPEFMISSTDGQSCSGQTPDIAWEGFQKKSCVRIKFWRGKRFSCKIDGAELFGFKNPQVMRLLRGLKANASQITEKSLPSLPFDIRQSEGTHEHHTKCPDLQVNLVKVQGKEKKSKKRKETHVKSVGGPGPKRERPQDMTQTQSDHEPHCRQSFEGNHNNEILSSSSNLNGNNTPHLVLAEEGTHFASFISSDHLEKEKCLSVQEANNSIGSKDLMITEEASKLLKSQENHDLMFNRTPGCTFSNSVDEKGNLPLQKESQMLDDVNLYAPDTLDLASDSACNLEVEIPKESTCTLIEKLNATEILVSEKCVTDSHSKDEMVIAVGTDHSEKGNLPLPKESQILDDVNLCAPDTLDLASDSACNFEVETPKESTCTLNEKLNATQFLVPETCVTDSHSKDEMVNAVGIDHSEKSDSDPVGQEISDSMMAVLLPRALPLLKTFSRKKKKSHGGIFQKERKEVDQYLKDKPPAGSYKHLEKLSGEVAIPDEPSTENFTIEKQNESVLLPSTSLSSSVPGLEDSATVAPDSFENNQCEIMDCSQARQVEDAIKADQSTICIDICNREGIHEVEVSVGNVSSMRIVDHVAHKGIIDCTGGVDVAIPSHQEVDGLISSLQGHSLSQHDKTEMVHSDEEAKVGPNDELGNIFELVGRYMLPTPISLAMLRTKGNEIFVCVLCGYLMENERTLFIYKTSIKGETRGCPSFIGHTTIISPTSRNASGRQVILDSSSLQLTPDGKYLVLLNNIKAPYCREFSVNCGCSVCKSECFEKNAVKIVQVKLGYVQVVCKLKTTNNVCSILVCEPSYLVASEESGKMNLWTMDSSWRAPTDQSYLSTSDCMPNIVEMKRIPNSPALIVGHSAFGDFFLWDLTRRTLLSKFSAPRTSFLSFIPVNFFRYPTQPFSTSDACRKKQIEDIMEETHRWSLETDNDDTLPVEKEHLSLVLLVSSVSNPDLFDEYSHKDLGVRPAGSWSLALLAKSKLVSENALDQSATVVGASSGYGIIGTCDGSLYIWELSTGSKLGYLSHHTGATMSCLAVDDFSGAFAVAVDGSQLQIYAPGTFANKKHMSR
ncbi:hypothetical protein QVD17_35498 [Tagetes erecta]|uniref:FYR C-terminal domain-containing protein n=1 Tax=Tagetes erecta TaxID=13708 RepID=A0AAD8JZL5_TARER|nr:hypothetical protein QVD17_35498 [Tagetes erecta]